MHPDQVAVSPETVAALVADQFPAYGGRAVTAVTSGGTVNAIFRIGDDVAARFPLVPDVDPARARSQLLAEADAAQELVGATRFSTPEPLGVGEPGAGYPGPWSLQTWLAGDVRATSSRLLAADLADLVTGIRALPTRGRRFAGAGRGGDLTTHEVWMRTCFEQSAALLDVPRLQARWAQLRDLPRTTPDVTTHGDLIPGNLLLRDGRLTGVLDVGGVGPADPALDLVVAWHALDAPARRHFRERVGCDEVEWARGQAWAFEQAMGLVWYYERSNPPLSELGRRTLDRLLEQ